MRQWSADSVRVVWLGLDLEEGLAEGTFVQQARDGPSFGFKPNGHGGGIRMFNRNTSGLVTVSIDAESGIHQILLAAHLLDLQTQNVVGPMIVLDRNTNETYTYSQAHIPAKPEMLKSTEGARASWIFQYTAEFFTPGSATRNRVGT